MEQNNSGKTGGIAGKGFARRLVWYAIGLFTLALGVSISIKSNLGVSPVSSIPYVYSLILNMDMGIVTAMLMTIYVLIQILLLRKKYELRSLLQLILGVAFGSFVAITNRLVVFPTPENYLLRLLLLGVSILCIAVGLTFILAADIAPQPPEGLMLVISRLTGKPFPRIKVAFDSTVVTLAGLSSILFLGSLQGVREGTLISAITIGMVIGLLRKYFGGQIDRLLGYAPAAKEAPAGEEEAAAGETDSEE